MGLRGNQGEMTYEVERKINQREVFLLHEVEEFPCPIDFSTKLKTTHYLWTSNCERVPKENKFVNESAKKTHTINVSVQQKMNFSSNCILTS